jgi:AraC-like DNA-binding protein
MSKASIEILSSSKRDPFISNQFDKKCFQVPFHYHPELELTYITEGSGKRYVGNNMAGFQKNDLVLLGSNLPHCWKLSQPKTAKAGSIVIQFSYDFLGKDFFETSGMMRINRMIKRSESGIQFNVKIVLVMRDAMNSVINEKDRFRKLMMLLEILNRLSSSKDYVLLSENNFIPQQSDYNLERINKVYAYIVDNFQDEISLDKAARLVNMTPNVFCKYFKNTTRKTFIERVIDFRINFATQLLTETDKTIADVCFESGFRDMSHFYKMFTSRMKTSPLNYRKSFLQETSG